MQRNIRQFLLISSLVLTTLSIAPSALWAGSAFDEAKRPEHMFGVEVELKDFNTAAYNSSGLAHFAGVKLSLILGELKKVAEREGSTLRAIVRKVLIMPSITNVDRFRYFPATQFLIFRLNGDLKGVGQYAGQSFDREEVALDIIDEYDLSN